MDAGKVFKNYWDNELLLALPRQVGPAPGL